MTWNIAEKLILVDVFIFNLLDVQEFQLQFQYFFPSS